MLSRARLSIARVLLLTLAGTAGCSSDGAPPPGSGLVFIESSDRGSALLSGAGSERPSFVDFGNVPNGEVVQHTFFLRNDDAQPIVIEELKSSCGCTVPQLLYRAEDGTPVPGNKARNEIVLELPAGAVLEVTLQVNTEAVRTKNADKFTFVRLTTNSPRSAYVELEGHLVVEELFQAVPKELDLDRVAQSGSGIGEVEIARAYPNGALLGDILDVPPDLIATLEPELRGNAPVWVLRAEITPPHDVGMYRTEISIETLSENGDPFVPLIVPVVANIVPDVEVLPARLHTGTLDSETGGHGEVELHCNVDGHRVRILGGEVLGKWSEHLTLAWAPHSTDAEGRSEAWTVSLTAAAGIDDQLFHGDVVLELDDASISPLSIPYAGLTRGPSQ